MDPHKGAADFFIDPAVRGVGWGVCCLCFVGKGGYIGRGIFFPWVFFFEVVDFPQGEIWWFGMRFSIVVRPSFFNFVNYV